MPQAVGVGGSVDGGGIGTVLFYHIGTSFKEGKWVRTKEVSNLNYFKTRSRDSSEGATFYVSSWNMELEEQLVKSTKKVQRSEMKCRRSAGWREGGREKELTETGRNRRNTYLKRENETD